MYKVFAVNIKTGKKLKLGLFETKYGAMAKKVRANYYLPGEWEIKIKKINR